MLFKENTTFNQKLNKEKLVLKNENVYLNPWNLFLVHKQYPKID